MSAPGSLRALAAAALIYAAALLLPAPAPAQGRPDCTVILRKMHDARGHGHAKEADSLKIAEKLGVDSDWVQRCAEAYGRHVKVHPKKENGESEKEFNTKLETEEYDELAREEKDTAGDHYFTEIENDDQDRRKVSHARQLDTINEWDPIETHEWEPSLGHEWQPFIHDDDLGEVE